MYKKEFSIPSKHHNKTITFDITAPITDGQLGTVIFMHGFKGFKDWGCWHLVAQEFASHGFSFLKMNFSHNSTSPAHLHEFVDLEAFGLNNYIIELDDLENVIQFLTSQPIIQGLTLNPNNIFLIGHSRGAAIALIGAQEQKNIKAIASWAGVTDLLSWTSKFNNGNWEKDGAIYIENARTKQKMPLYYQLYETTIQNNDRLNIEHLVRNTKIPVTAFHGTKDEALPIDMINNLKLWAPGTKVYLIEGANHVFGGSHPYTNPKLPPHLFQVVQDTIAFFKNAQKV